jgi:RecA-family ATPase
VADDWTPVAPKAPRPAMRWLSDIPSESISWLWPGRIPLGKLTLFCGDPGLGKSLVALDCAARVTQARDWPDGAPGMELPGSVLLLSAEDDPADTQRPRLEAAGAEITKVRIIDGVEVSAGEDGARRVRPFCLGTDIPILKTMVRQTLSVRMVIIDPLLAFTIGTDTHKNSDVRGLLTPLSTLAAEQGVAIVGIMHLNKSAGGPAIYRSTGSLAFAAAARSVLAVVKDRDNEARRLLLSVKTNIGAALPGLAYTIAEDSMTRAPIIVWETKPVLITADEALSNQTCDPEERTAREEAREFLRSLLASGRMSAEDVKKQAREAGIAEQTLNRAKRDLGIRPHKLGFEAGWSWELPS